MDNGELKTRIKSLEEQLHEYEKRLINLENIEAIKRLQKAYNYYVEHMMGQEIIDCFSDSRDVVLNWLEGKWIGKEGVKKYFARATLTDRPPGFSHQLMPIGGLITIDPDGLKASGRWYAFGGIFTARDGNINVGSLTSGIYEMRYIKEDGTWKILSINWFIPYGVRIPEGWTTPENIGRRFVKGESTIPENEVPRPEVEMPVPDIPVDPDDLRYVSGYIFPHHFRHPVTGKVTSEAERNSHLKPFDRE